MCRGRSFGGQVTPILGFRQLELFGMRMAWSFYRSSVIAVVSLCPCWLSLRRRYNKHQVVNINIVSANMLRYILLIQ